MNWRSQHQKLLTFPFALLKIDISCLSTKLFLPPFCDAKKFSAPVNRRPMFFGMVNNLHEPRQSAYKAFHSKETAVLSVTNDIMLLLVRDENVFLCCCTCRQYLTW